MASKRRGKRGSYKSLQSIFDKVTRRLLKQGQKAETARGCVLRTPDGLVCAVGALVPKAKYSPEFEDQVLDFSLNGKLARVTGLRTARQQALVDRLREVHDDSDTESWREGFNNVAREFGLREVRV